MRYTPGRSAAVSRTFDFIIDSWASLLGRFSRRGVPRVISVLAPHAHCRRAPIDSVCRHQLRSASAAGKSTATIHVQFLDERTPLSARISVIPEARPARSYRFAQNVDDRFAKQ